MRHVVLALILLMTLARAVAAQPSHGYVFFAPGGLTCCGHTTAMTLQFGVGGEAVLGKGIGVGAEIGALGTRQYYLDSVVGMLSPNGYYHFVHGKEVRFDPYVTGGYTLLFRGGHANLFNFGGGMNYWFRRRLAFQTEIRDQVYSQSGNNLHYWGVRLGLAFR